MAGHHVNTPRNKFNKQGTAAPIMPKSRVASKGTISVVLNALDHGPLLADGRFCLRLKRLWKTFQVLSRKRDDTALFHRGA